MMKLTSRQKKLFHWVVQRYIGTASPVASDHLVRFLKLDCSPATVRNEMVYLEDAGFVKQPHTSAGRIPTDLGYRFYVNNLMKQEPMRAEEEHQIYESIHRVKGNVRFLLEETSKLLSAISEELAIVMTPCISHAVFDRLELIALSREKILVVIHVRSRRVKTVIIQINYDFQDSDLEKAASLLNERISGLTLNEIHRTIQNCFNRIDLTNYSIVRTILESAQDLFDLSSPLEMVTSGAQNFLSQPEFSDKDNLQNIFSFVEDKKGVMGFFKSKPETAGVSIGWENEDPRLQSFSIVTTSYHMGNEEGMIGVIGPTRMRYNKIMPLVNHMAHAVTRFFS